MMITVNGRAREVAPGTSVGTLLETLSMEIARVAVEFNRAILPRDRLSATLLQEGDTLEIVQFVGGG
jgi:thiazole synthase/sulfur carrier protein